MVREKYRYIILKYSFDTSVKYSVNKDTLLKIINNLIRIEYGEYGLSKVTDYSVISSYPFNGYILFRLGRKCTPLVVQTLKNITNLNGKMCNFCVEGVSGNIKKAEKRILKKIKN
ncbi:hypothetical protein TUBRATIS_22940 [Tubulinosema ratisbonensis]|uniref:Ribonuclease P/MRP protein subunit POP5 n=1 Tax=Tubulinosema ratisbonensis TaxID=291195 RepID=A0A437AJQ2_9MICR|nr:hypothetical protein TUBRATIS_22940 [Tubulinosema ratisbonensis]